VTYTASGLGGSDSLPTTVTIDTGGGDFITVAAPTYNQLSLAGYASPLPFLRRSDLEDVNAMLDASQQFAQAVGADYMMNARVDLDELQQLKIEFKKFDLLNISDEEIEAVLNAIKSGYLLGGDNNYTSEPPYIEYRAQSIHYDPTTQKPFYSADKVMVKIQLKVPPYTGMDLTTYTHESDRLISAKVEESKSAYERYYRFTSSDYNKHGSPAAVADRQSASEALNAQLVAIQERYDKLGRELKEKYDRDIENYRDLRTRTDKQWNDMVRMLGDLTRSNKIVGPKKVGPKKVGPRKVGPKKVGPRKVGPRKVGPKIVGPKIVGPKIVGPKPTPKPPADDWTRGGIQSGSVLQFGARLLRSFTDSSRFAGDFMFKGLPKGTPYLPDFTGAAQKGPAAWLTGGKKWSDVFGGLGRAIAGKNYASQHFTPSLNKALDYAKEGGRVVVMPRTPGVQGFKNWFGSSVSRGFGLGDIEKLVRTSDTIKSFNQGTTKIFDRADPEQMAELQKLATQGAKTNTMLAKLGRAVPFVGAAAAIFDVSTRLSKGDYFGAVLGGASAIPGPIGWAALGAQVLYDVNAIPFLGPEVKNAMKDVVPELVGLSNSSQMRGNVLIEQMESEYLNTMRQALFDLGVPKDRKEYAIQQGTLLTLMGVNPELVSIITIAAAGEEFSPEQKKWIENNLISMIEIFSALRENQKDIKIRESILLPESHQRILREIKQPVKLKESTTWDRARKHLKGA